ncbi:MAG: Tex family protein [Planctomycetota bacterium]|nr:Tex family protein [Planctomycetota bacterium]
MTSRSFECFDYERAVQQIAGSLSCAVRQVHAAVDLLETGNTIPFIARYRKEATSGLDEIALRGIEDAFSKARELAQRKTTILKTIDEHGLLTTALHEQIRSCTDKHVLENLYSPFKPKRRTRAAIARERGLQPLADILLRQEVLQRSRGNVLSPFVSPENGVPDEEAALQGACDIVAEHWSENVQTRSWLAGQAAGYGRITSKVKRGKNDADSKFAMYFDHQEAAKRVPSHRFLAMKRGETEGILRIGIKLDDAFVLRKLTPQLAHNRQFEFHHALIETVKDCYERLLLPAVESSLLHDLKEKSDEEAIAVFAKNMRELLLAPPAGPQVTIGIDPGYRTGCKVAVVDGTGKFLDSATIYPTPPRNDTERAGETLREMVSRFDARLIAIGNGTASRETDAFVAEVIRSSALDVTKVVVSESGASIYSASPLAAREYPDLDVTVRGAISIAHRLQDPLAELVKIDPKSIGVGQYQHDVNQALLRKTLGREVESCVNSVGVDVNMASPVLLSYVAGIGPKLAQRIVDYRDVNGRFEARRQLCSIPKLGRKAYEQAAGFLRIRDGNQPLDNSSVHPESYYVVKQMASQMEIEPQRLVGNPALVARLNADEFVDDQFGLPTIEDILAELAKPGRDPRNEFRVAKFVEGVNELKDLKEGMMLEGVITNVTKFGAFIDLGVHQDGLIHVSQLADHYVQDPGDVVTVGDVVRVKVLDVDLQRRRIAVSRKMAMGN